MEALRHPEIMPIYRRIRELLREYLAAWRPRESDDDDSS